MTGRVKSARRRGGPQLPRSLQAVWGIRTKPDRGPRPGLSLERIVGAAVTVAAADGLAAVSMSRVAAELDVATMSLYRYVGAKDELLALMVDSVFDRPPAPRADDESWREALSRWARDHLAVLRRHSWVVRVPISGPPVLPNAMTWFERGLGCLKDTGLTESQKLSTLLLLNGFVRNDALMRWDIETAARAAGAAARRAMASYGTLLAQLTHRDRFPAIHALITARVFEGVEKVDAEFEFGLARILDGVGLLMRQARR